MCSWPHSEAFGRKGKVEYHLTDCLADISSRRDHVRLAIASLSEAETVWLLLIPRLLLFLAWLGKKQICSQELIC